MRPSLLPVTAALLFLSLPVPVSAESIISMILGDAPDSAGALRDSPREGIDSIAVARRTDTGDDLFEDLVGRLAGADMAQTGSDGVLTPFDLSGVGRGRTTLEFNGLPAGEGLVHWDNYGWVPIRSLSSFTGERTAAAVSSPLHGGAGGHLDVRPAAALDQPLSSITITGGSFGHRLAELDFARTFGKYGFHGDVADLSYNGTGAFGETRVTRGFGEFSFPLFGHRAAFSAALYGGHVESPFLSGIDLQETDENRLALVLERRSETGFSRWSLFSHSSHLASDGSSTSAPFDLSDWRSRLGWRRELNFGSSLVSVDFFGAREERSGVLLEDREFWSAGGAIAGTFPISGAWKTTARVGFVHQDPMGAAVEPGLRLHEEAPGRRLWIEAGRRTGVPGILLNQGAAAVDVTGLETILQGLEDLDAPESHWIVGGGGVFGGARAGAGIAAGGARTSDSPGWLSPARGVFAFDPVEESYVTGHVSGALFWVPRTDLAFSVRGGWHSFDRDRQPYKPDLTGDGSITFRRDFFESDLKLAAILGGVLIGERRDLEGFLYPPVLSGYFTLTGRIRSLTLFWRTENLSGNYIESDLMEGGNPVPLPGLHNRIGASLRLVD